MSGARQHRTDRPSSHPRYNQVHAFISHLHLFVSSLRHLQPSRSPPLQQLAPSHEGQDAVDQQGHDGGAEQAGHGHGDEPRQEDVPEEAPVHCLLGADPADGHDRAHLEAAPSGGGEKKENISGSLGSMAQSDRVKSCRLLFRGVTRPNVMNSFANLQLSTAVRLIQ